MATSTLDHFLAHHLAQNDAVPAALADVLDTLVSQRVIARCEGEEGLNGPLLYRWQMRLTSLASASNAAAVRTAAFQLLLHTFTSSTTLFLSAGKTALSYCQSVLASPKSDPALLVAALDLARLILAKSNWHPEWARENVGAQAVQKLVGGLVQAHSGESSEVMLPCVATIVSLIPLYPTALRPLSPSFHTLAITLLSDVSRSSAVVDAGAQLFVSLYLLAPKGKEGLREAWRTSIEALIGSVDQLASHVTQGIFAEDVTYNHLLSPLALPPLADDSPASALSRLESLTRALLLILRTPTTEKAGPVHVPVGALVELGVRLTSFSTESPIKERTDPTLLTATVALTPRLQIQGCQLLAQLALSVGPQLSTHASVILSTLAKTLSSYPVRSPMRPAVSTTYAIVLQALGASLDPEEGKKSLARVWRTVLEDIGAVATEPVVVAQSKEDGKSGGGRKAKRQKTYDPGESMAQRRVAIEDVDFEIAERGLATLERLLRCPHAHFLPPALQLGTSRLLLYLSLSPSFFLTHPLASTSSSFFPATTATQPLDIVKQLPSFRRAGVRALSALTESGLGGMGIEEKAVEVWRRGSLDADEEVKAVSVVSLLRFGGLVHPLLPPQQPNAGLTRVRHDQRGGFVGDKVDFEKTAEEFRMRLQEQREHGEEDDQDEDMSAKETVEQEERRRKSAAVAASLAPAPQTATFSSTAFSAPFLSTAPAASTSTAHDSGFSAFAAPAFGTSTASAHVPLFSDAPAPSANGSSAIASAEVEGSGSTTVPVQTIAIESVRVERSKTMVTAPSKAAEADGDDSEDDDMPAIDLGSDEE
ncbi:armadillo-type fold domain containing protein [Rhodotorula toruloides]|uniref:Pre-rRNA-processing protein RIX1 n=1 Tax=Rhodotorula toruloides TaxID=5286 RepID=A0A511KGY6_RHOTO|nr:armadillo-type fold domain containing protein [Rhodotorula toruloides]